MSSMKKKIAIFTGPEGHLSMAEALAEALSDEYQTEVFFDRDNLFDLYTPIYQLFPFAHSIPYNLAKLPTAQKILLDIFLHKYDQKITEFCEKFSPDANISTYFMFNPILERFKRAAQIPFFNVITDPWTIHPLLISDHATANFDFDKHATGIIHRLRPEARVVETGWILRPAFKPIDSKTKLLSQLGLENKPTLLLVSGSEGTATIMKIIPALFNYDLDLQVVVACGNNKSLYQGVQALNKLLKSTTNKSPLIPLSFVKNLNQYIQVADLVVGKAGPNTLFEAAATHTPFFAITHINGQEDGNLDIIKKYKLGFVEESPLKAAPLLIKIMKDPDKYLKPLEKHVKSMAEHNADAIKTIRNEIKEALAES